MAQTSMPLYVNDTHFGVRQRLLELSLEQSKLTTIPALLACIQFSRENPIRPLVGGVIRP